MAGRGQLTDEIQAVAKEHLGRDITTIELRFMNYVAFEMVNEQKIKRNKIDQKERYILAQWEEEGLVLVTATKIKVTKKFWDAMSEILWLAYAVSCGGELK